MPRVTLNKPSKQPSHVAPLSPSAIMQSKKEIGFESSCASGGAIIKAQQEDKAHYDDGDGDGEGEGEGAAVQARIAAMFVDEGQQAVAETEKKQTRTRSKSRGFGLRFKKSISSTSENRQGRTAQLARPKELEGRSLPRSPRPDIVENKNA